MIDWTPGAQARLLRLHSYIAEKNPRAADRMVALIIKRVELLESLPQASRAVPELRSEHVREVLVRSYRIVFMLYRRRLRILSVFDGRRRLRPEDLDPAD